MKVITEEGLRYVLKMHFGSDDVNQSICSHLINELQELDTLTVSNLRPMGDLLKLKDYKTEVLATRNSETFMKIRQSSGDEVYCFELGKYLPASQFIGWIHAPVINLEEPAKEMIWPNSCG